MDYMKRWEVIGDIGSGGQGKVYKVIDKKEFNIDEKIFPELSKAFLQLSAGSLNIEQKREALKIFRKSVSAFAKIENPHYHYALKELHEVHSAVNEKTAEKRIKNEIEAMAKSLHKNLLPIIEYDPDGKWYVSKYYSKGCLKNNSNIFTGEPLKSLTAIRPLIEAVTKLHENKIVHRDIKPENVFYDDNNNDLILGDFGLVFFDDDRTRYTETLENVGSRRWMPSWVMDMRIEDVTPSFDVFSLGKLIWAMISKEPVLTLWYFNSDRHPKFNLENMFPENNDMKIINNLLSNCIVEHKEDCLESATELLNKIDETIIKLKSKADLIGDGIERKCKVCGIGKYKSIIDKDTKNYSTDLRNFGLNSVSGSEFKIFACHHCGHLQLFSFRDSKNNPAWIKRK